MPAPPPPPPPARLRQCHRGDGWRRADERMGDDGLRYRLAWLCASALDRARSWAGVRRWLCEALLPREEADRGVDKELSRVCWVGVRGGEVARGRPPLVFTTRGCCSGGVHGRLVSVGLWTRTRVKTVYHLPPHFDRAHRRQTGIHKANKQQTTNTTKDPTHLPPKASTSSLSSPPSSSFPSSGCTVVSMLGCTTRFT